MAKHESFYETVQEANMRLQGTVVMYDGNPYEVLVITDHMQKQDESNEKGFRLYAVEFPRKFVFSTPVGNYPKGHEALGQAMDEFLKSPDGVKAGAIRKSMSSPKFNKFRPFPLGFVNFNGQAIYVERQPKRKSEQGLASFMLMGGPVEFNIDLSERIYQSDIPQKIWSSTAMRDTMKGVFPPIEQILEKYKDDSIQNKAVAFHRDFAILKGPANLIFLAYKRDIVGYLPGKSTKELWLAPDFTYLVEVLAKLGTFDTIKVAQ